MTKVTFSATMPATEITSTCAQCGDVWASGCPVVIVDRRVAENPDRLIRMDGVTDGTEGYCDWVCLLRKYNPTQS